MNLMRRIPVDAPLLTDRPRSDYPLSGVKTGPAWRAAWDMLREGYADDYLPSGQIAEAVVEKCPGVHPDTVKNILLSACVHGVLVKTYVMHNSRRQAAYRISDDWIKGQG
jgi:hypothetical protein